MAESDTFFHDRNRLLLHWRTTSEIHKIQFPCQDLSRHRAPDIRILRETAHINFQVAVPSHSRVLDTGRESLREVVPLG